MKSPFLLYHKIDKRTPDVKIGGAFTSPRSFERQIRFLKKHGIKFLTASEMVAYYVEQRRFPERTVCVTFDDGWKDNYTNAFPILKKYGVPATIFIVPSVLGETTDSITADGEGPREHMSVADVQAMAAAGIEFGSHTMHHKLLHQAADKEAEDEIRLSKSAIEAIAQKECRTFAYPAGFVTEYAAKCAVEAGYRAAFTTTYGRDDGQDLFRINRTEILRRDAYPFQFSKKIKLVVS